MSFSRQFEAANQSYMAKQAAETFKTNQEGAWHGADISSQADYRANQSGIGWKNADTEAKRGADQGALARSQASLYGSQAVAGNLNNSTNAQDLQRSGYSTDQFMGQRYAAGGFVDAAKYVGGGARTLWEGGKALAKDVGRSNIPGGESMAGWANDASALVSGARSGFTGDKYTPNQYRAKEFRELAGYKPTYAQEAGAQPAVPRSAPAAAIQPPAKIAVAEKPAPRAEPRESAKSNADWNAWVAHANKPQALSMEDRLQAMAPRMGSMARDATANMVGAMGALTQRDKANQEAAHQALYGPAQIRQADAQARYYDSQGAAARTNAGTNAARVGVAGKAQQYKALVDQLATMSTGDPKKDAANPMYQKYLARVQGLDDEMTKMSEFAFTATPENFAEGGMIGAIGAAPQQDPMTARYGQYVHAAMQAGVQPLPMEKFVGLLAATQAKMQQAPAGAQPGQPQGYAAGGAIEVEGQQVLGPGTGKSDSIPAIIDGKRPAALSTGEFVMPVEAVQHFGLDRLTKMVAAARKGQQANA
jgi:hypothetical protein